MVLRMTPIAPPPLLSSCATVLVNSSGYVQQISIAPDTPPATMALPACCTDRAKRENTKCESNVQPQNSRRRARATRMPRAAHLWLVACRGHVGGASCGVADKWSRGNDRRRSSAFDAHHRERGGRNVISQLIGRGAERWRPWRANRARPPLDHLPAARLSRSWSRCRRLHQKATDAT